MRWPFARRVSFTRGERHILRKPRRVPPSVWCEQHLWVVTGDFEGPWRNANMPHLAGILDASFFPSVRTVIHCKPPQVGSTVALTAMLLFAMDMRPGPAMLGMPNEALCREASSDRIVPMIRKSTRLRALVTNSPDDLSSLRVRTRTMTIHMAWSGSAARLGDKSCKYIIGDELDKWDLSPDKNKEAAGIDLLRKRTTAYKESYREWFASTPTTTVGPIWEMLQSEAAVIFDFWPVCPFCFTAQEMEFSRIRVPENERDPELIDARQMAWYECKYCGARWDDHHRDVAVRAGSWRARDDSDGRAGEPRELMVYLEAVRPHKIAFHTRSWISPMVSLSSVMAAWFRGQKNRMKLRDFMNSHMAEPWQEYGGVRMEDRILALRDARPSGLVPGGDVVAALTAGVDTQDDGFYYVIRAWGYGLSEESWLVRHGFVTSFEAVLQILLSDEYCDAAGHRYIVRLALQDMQGHRARQVAEFARQYPGRIIPFRGTAQKNQTCRWVDMDAYPGTNIRIPGGMKRLDANVDYYKGELAAKLEIAPGDPGAFYLHSGTSLDYARQMTAEVYDSEKNQWIARSGVANHYWDCEVYALIAADVLGVRHWSRPSADVTGTRRVLSSGL